MACCCFCFLSVSLLVSLSIYVFLFLLFSPLLACGSLVLSSFICTLLLFVLISPLLYSYSSVFTIFSLFLSFPSISCLQVTGPLLAVNAVAFTDCSLSASMHNNTHTYTQELNLDATRLIANKKTDIVAAFVFQQFCIVVMSESKFLSKVSTIINSEAILCHLKFICQY